MDYLILGIALAMWAKTAESEDIDSESRRRNCEMARAKLAQCDNRLGRGLGLRAPIPFCRAADEDRKDR
jgi:hypothetical protein